MTCSAALETYLGDHQVRYTTQRHPPAFTAQEVAASEHLPAMMMAKVVVVVADDALAMLVLPAAYRVDMRLVGDALGARRVRLADEPMLATVFPDCEVGAMPPFGNLYGVPVYVAAQLATQQRIVFQAGTHTDTIEITYADYARLLRPIVEDFARHMRELLAPEWS
jgi:Ala-tRNA(Pro) deacylase